MSLSFLRRCSLIGERCFFLLTEPKSNSSAISSAVLCLGVSISCTSSWSSITSDSGAMISFEFLSDCFLVMTGL